MSQKILTIDDELMSLLEPHSKEEFEQLRKNILEDGRVIDPIIVWEGEDIIVDGMTRYQIALAEGVPFNTIEIPFEDRAQVKEWVFAHQFGRRNGDGLARSRWRAMLVEAKASSISSGNVPKSRVVREIATTTGVTERQVWVDTAVAEVLDSLPLNAKRNIENRHIAATPASIARIRSLPETQKSQVCDVLENLPTGIGEDLVFRSVDEVIDAVQAHQESTANTPVQINKKLEQELAKMEGVIESVPSRVDSIALAKKLHRTAWKERVQVAFANFVSIWREQCKKP